MQERTEEWQKEKALMIAENEQKDEQVQELVEKHENIIKHMESKHKDEIDKLIKRHDHVICEHQEDLKKYEKLRQLEV